jgi:hypothetical protein
MRRALSPGTTRIFFINYNTEKRTSYLVYDESLIAQDYEDLKKKKQKNNSHLVYDESLIAGDCELV